MKRKLTIFLCLLLSCCSFSQLFSQTRLGLHYTLEEVKVWKERALKGPYKSKGDAALNTPGDWDRIVKNKNYFMTNPSAGRWIGPPGTGCVAVYNQQVDGVDVPKKTIVGKMQDAAFYAMLYNDKAIKALVKKELLWQASHAGVDFTNKSRWCGKINDNSPNFEIAIWGCILLYTYEYVEDVFTTEEKEKFESWLDGFARYIQQELDIPLNRLYKNRGVEKIEDYVYIGGVKPGDYIYANGYQTIAVQKFYNNRRAHMMQLVGEVGIKFNNPGYIKSAKNFIRETIAFMCFPDGTFAELHRSIPSLPSKGLNYLANTFGSIIMVADALARTGDFSMYDFKTSFGIGQTKGNTEKSIEWIITEYGKYLDGQKKVYAKEGTVGDLYYRMDGTHSNWTMMSDATNFAIANIYYKNPYNKAVYMRTAPGIYSYPATGLASNGTTLAWKGLVGHTAGLFQYAQMEGKVWPYPSRSVPVVNKAPVVSAGDDFTVSLPLTELTVVGTANDPDGKIASYKWAKITGPALEMTSADAPSVSLTISTPGTYVLRLSVIDDKGASAYDEVTLIVNPASPLSITFASTNVSCYGGNNGHAGVVASGGTEKYFYEWSNGDTTNEIDNLSAGTYTVKVSDTGGNTTTGTVTISENTALVVLAEFQNETATGNDGSIDISVSGGKKPYFFSWSNGESTEDLEGLTEGEYIVSIKDSFGCSLIHKIVLEKVTPPEVIDEPGQEQDPEDTVVIEEPVVIDPIEEPVVIVEPRENNSVNKPEEQLAFNVRKIFSPNGDGLGDETWKIDNVEEIQGCKVVVFTETGKKVFETFSYNNDWDGRINGTEAPEGGYYYVIQCPEANIFKKGAIRLVR